LLAVVAVGGLGVGVWLGAASYLPGGPVGEPINTVARERTLSPISACLLTDAGGVGRKPAADVWAGLQDAAADAKARATFLPLLGAGSPADQVNAMIAQGCNLIAAVGNKPQTAVQNAAGANPGVHFVVAGSTAGEHVDTFAPTRDGARAMATRTFRAIEGSAS
jgi:basic membrane lipoprotein Med (substrate-binding protein (PBP1-ABC) superfamily)